MKLCLGVVFSLFLLGSLATAQQAKPAQPQTRNGRLG
jgi:hypothetical protein